LCIFFNILIQILLVVVIVCEVKGKRTMCPEEFHSRGLHETFMKDQLERKKKQEN